MARGLKGITRYRRYQVDQARRELGKLLSQAAALEQRASSLEAEIVAEQRAASENPAEAGFTYGQYARNAILRRAQLAQAISIMEARIVEAQDNVRTEFRELKVVEIAQETRDAEEALEANRAAQSVLDEIGVQLFRRENS